METAAHSVYSMHMLCHGGWSSEEDKLLFEEVKKAREAGRSLKSAFDRMENLTGRKSNSIRNYYYVRIRDEDIMNTYSECVEKPSSFIPFEESEVKSMLKRLLSDQAKGISVRASTMALGNGDTTTMLRFQNKYRSVIKNNPEFVKTVMAEMESEGLPVFDPYAARPGKKLGRPRKETQTGLVDVMAQTVSELGNVEGLNVSQLFESLGALALSASRGAKAIKQLEQLDGSSDNSIIVIEEENQELKEMLFAQEQELSKSKAQLSAAISAFRRLLQINTGFLELTGVAKVSSLSGYIRELTHTISYCREAISDIG